MYYKNSDEKSDKSKEGTFEEKLSTDPKKKKEGPWTKLKNGVTGTIKKGVKAIGTFAVRGAGTIAAGYVVYQGAKDVAIDTANGGLGNLEDGARIAAEAVGTLGMMGAAFDFATKGAGAGLKHIGKAALMTGGTFGAAHLGGGVVTGMLASDKSGSSGPVYTSREEWEQGREIPTFTLEPEDGGKQDGGDDLSFG